MQCPECNNKESIRDCRESIIYCQKCGLILTASHEYVNGQHLNLPYGFRNSIRQCEQPTNTEYHALYQYYKDNRLEYDEDLPINNKR